MTATLTSVLPQARPLRPLFLTAGLLYLLIILCGISAEVLVRQKLLVNGEPQATLANTLAAPGRYRLGLLLDTLMLLCDVALAVLLYRLLRPLNPLLSLLAMVFRLVQALLIAFSLLISSLPLLLLFPTAAQPLWLPQGMAEVAQAAFSLHAAGYDFGLIFFAVSNALLAAVLWTVGGLTRLLAVGLLLAAAVYWLGSVSRFLLPGSGEALAPLYLIPLLAELGFSGWLLALARGPLPAALQNGGEV